MPAAAFPVRPVLGTGKPSHRRCRAGYHELMATAVIPPAQAQRTPQTAASVHLAFRFGGSTLSLEVADAESRRLLEAAYAPMLCRTAGARARASLRRLSDGRLNVRYGNQVLRAASAVDAVPLRAAYHATREIFARFACEQAQTVALYGAACTVDEGAVLLLGPTTVGKTVLTLHLAARGAKFLGDETVLLSLAREEAYALPRRPSLRESALPLLPDARMAQAVLSCDDWFATERGRFWYSLDSQALCGIEPSERSHSVRAICIVQGRGERAEIRRLDSAEAVKFVAQRAYVRPTSLAQVAALRRALRHATFFEVTLAGPEETSELLLREVRACG